MTDNPPVPIARAVAQISQSILSGEGDGLVALLVVGGQPSCVIVGGTVTTDEAARGAVQRMAALVAAHGVK